MSDMIVIPRSPFWGKEKMQPLVHFLMVFYLLTMLHNQISVSLNVLVLRTSGGILSTPNVLLLLIFICIKFFLYKLSYVFFYIIYYSYYILLFIHLYYVCLCFYCYLYHIVFILYNLLHICILLFILYTIYTIYFYSY